MSESVKHSTFYECPNGCLDTWFFQNGTSNVTRKLTAEGEIMEEERFRFSAATPVRCYRCQAEAIFRTKTVRTITIVE